MSGRGAGGGHDAGFAIPMAILLGVVALILVSAATTYSLGRFGDSERRRDRVLAMPVIDTAVTRLKFGLEQGHMPEHNDYAPKSVQAYRSFVETAWGTFGAGRVISGSAAIAMSAAVGSPPPSYLQNVWNEEPMGNGLSGYWQIIDVFAPEYEDAIDEGVVVVYIRALVGTSGATIHDGAEHRLARVEFRPGRFVDYQAVIDGPIVFGPKAVLNGPIHSNGFGDNRTSMNDILAGKTQQILAVDPAQPVQCLGEAQITTASGTVAQTDFPNCPIEINTDRYINLLAAEEAFTKIHRVCGSGDETSGGVWCYNQERTGSDVPSSVTSRPIDMRGYRVKLEPSRIVISGYEVDPATQKIDGDGHVQTIDTTDDKTYVLYFADDVAVSGRTKARVTIAARKKGDWAQAPKSGAADIYVIGDTGNSVDSQGNNIKGSVLGLLSQGGVILEGIKNENGNYPCVEELRAGIHAMSGTLSIDPRYTTKLFQSGGPSCGPIKIRGSLAAHRSPILYWVWPNVNGHAGYSVRDYRWTDRLRRNPPPYFPTTDTWEARHVRPANVDCFQQVGQQFRIRDADC